MPKSTPKAVKGNLTKTRGIKPVKWDIIASYLPVIRAMKRDGKKDKEISLALGFPATTLTVCKGEARKAIEEEPDNFQTQVKREFLDALLFGQEEAVSVVEDSLFEQCKNGNMTAIMFYLKNKKPDKWSDKTDRKDTDTSINVNFNWDRNKEENKDG